MNFCCVQVNNFILLCQLVLTLKNLLPRVKLWERNYPLWALIFSWSFFFSRPLLIHFIKSWTKFYVILFFMFIHISTLLYNYWTIGETILSRKQKILWLIKTCDSVFIIKLCSTTNSWNTIRLNELVDLILITLSYNDMLLLFWLNKFVFFILILLNFSSFSSSHL